MCNCFAEVEDKIKARLKDKMPEGSVESTNTFDGAGWRNQALNFTTGGIEVLLKYALVFRAKKKNGDMAKNLSRLETNIKMSFCPFCGEKK